MRIRSSLGALAIAAALGVSAGSAFAAEELVIHVGAASRSIPVADLETFATTGEMSRQLQIYLDENSTPETAQDIRRVLGLGVQLDFVPFARFLRSDGGDCMLAQVAEVIRPTPDNTEGTQAVRAALVNAAAPDGQLTTIEILEMYPNSKMHVDRNQLSGSGEQVLGLSEDIQAVLVEAGVPIDQLQESVPEALATEPGDGSDSPTYLSLAGIDYDSLASGSARLCEQL